MQNFLPGFVVLVDNKVADITNNLGQLYILDVVTSLQSIKI